MSSKLSPKKDEKITASPTKKDNTASSSAIMTRHQSVVMNTRQLRNQDASRKKISAFTQLLLGPNKDKSKTTTFNKRKSPKDKKVKGKESPKKRPMVKVSQLVLEVKKEAKAAAKKRKTVAESTDVRPAKSRKESAILGVQELIDMCEEQSLDDESFLEILTCESPVWWEQPDNQYYCEDAIATTGEQKRYFQKFFKSQVKTEPIIPDTTNIKIPEVKKTDDKFMKKRNKLENLLGNIKNKLTDTPKEEEKHTDKEIDQNSHIPEIIQVKENIATDTIILNKFEEKSIEDEIEHNKARNVKTLSESTSSSDDMFFGFQNEDILKDLENMVIPIKEDEPSKECLEFINTSPKKDNEIKDDNSNAKKQDKKNGETNFEEEVTSVNSVNHNTDEKNLIANSFLEISKQKTAVTGESKGEIINVEVKISKATAPFDSITNTPSKPVHPGTHSSLEMSSYTKSESTESHKPINTVASKTPKTKASPIIITNTSGKDVYSGTRSIIENSLSSSSDATETHKSLNPVKIYYIDASTKNEEQSKNDKTSTTKDLLSNAKKDESTNLNKKPIDNEKSSTSTHIAKQTNESDINNDESATLNKNNERSSSSTIIANQKNKSSINLPNENKDVSTVIDKNDKINGDGNKTKIIVDNKDSTKNDKDSKSTKPKQVNKDQLMAVYKIITDKEFRQNYMKTVENEAEKSPKIINSYLASSDGLKRFLNNCVVSSKEQCPKLDGKNNENSTEKAINSNEIDVKEKIFNEDRHNLNNDRAIDKKVECVNNTDSKEYPRPINTVEVNKSNEQTNDEKCANATKTGLKENNSGKLCGSCDDTNTETSFNITSKVKSAKYCLKCSSIFESETCSYCAKKSKLNLETSQSQQSRKGNM